MKIDFANTEISTWFERDRSHVCLSLSDGETIVEWWDEAVAEAVADGFLKAGDWHRSAYAYAEDHGLLAGNAEPVSIKPIPTGWVGELPGSGVYCGWRKGGAPMWSSEITDAEAARGAYVFDTEEDARELFERDEIEGGNFALVEIDVVPEGRSTPTRASFGNCENAGLETARSVSAPAP